MRNIRILLEYDGSRYQGFMSRDSDKTVMNRLKASLLQILGEEPEVYVAVKTDPYVHALSQTVSVRCDTGLSVRELKSALNKTLPMDIAVLDAADMPLRFHASLNLDSCAYLYRVDLGDVPDLFTRKYALHVPGSLDVKAMETAGRLLCGTHDFSGFGAGHTRKSTVRSVTELSLYTGQAQNQLQFYICANRFLHMMPQLIVGTLLDIGAGLRTPEEIPGILDGTLKSSSPASPVGLCLAETNYL